MGAALPPALRAAIESLGQKLPAGSLSASAAGLSRTYRAHGGSQGLKGAIDVAAYVTARMPATFAAVAAALERMAEAAPGLRFESLADLGCGPGTAAFAALEQHPGIGAVALVDRNPALLAAAGTLFAEAGYGVGRTTRSLAASLLDSPLPAADLVLLSYALVEIDPAAVPGLVRRAFEAGEKALVLVEPGSQAGFGRIRLAREALIAAGASIVAPCPHALACPVSAPDWCHFSVRLARSRAHRLAKSASVPYEDEKFSYLVALKGAAAAPAGRRVIAPPHRTKAGLDFRICGPNGLEQQRILGREAQFRAFRGLEWGDLTPLD